MKENLLTWTVQNWVTVFLMWLLAWAILSLLIRIGKGGSVMPNRGNTAAGTIIGNTQSTDPSMV